MNNTENFWGDFFSRIQKMNVNKDLVEKCSNIVKTSELKEKHDENCTCGHCQQVNQKMLDIGRNEPLVEVKLNNKNSMCETSVPVNVETYKFMAGEQLEKFISYVKASDECIAQGPPLEHPNVSTWDDTKLALEKYKEYLHQDEEDVCCEKQSNEVQSLQGILIFYINVGQVPSDKAENKIKFMEDLFLKRMEGKFPESWKTLWLPVRDQATSVEVIRF
jgi:hypothetical protein